MKAFEAICKSKTIFMSECISANDTEEIVFTVEAMYSDILAKYKESPNFLDALRNIDNFTASIPDSIFALSLTGHPDLLSQWRGYGRDDGIVIGFGKRLLKDICISNGLSMGYVCYDPEFQDPIISVLTDIFIKIQETDEMRYKIELKRELMRKFIQVSPLIKHAAFHEEKEFRLYTTVLENDPYHLSSRFVEVNGRRFLPLELKAKMYNESHIFAEIVIGPSAEGEVGLDKVLTILDSNGYSCPDIRASTTPFQPVRR